MVSGCPRWKGGGRYSRACGSVLIWKLNSDSRFKRFLKFRRPFLTLGYHASLNPPEDGLMFFARLSFNLYNERLFFFAHLSFPRAGVVGLKGFGFLRGLTYAAVSVAEP
jgi:hypothetical protein